MVIDTTKFRVGDIVRESVWDYLVTAIDGTRVTFQNKYRSNNVIGDTWTANQGEDHFLSEAYIVKPKVWIIVTHERGDSSTINAVCSSEENAKMLLTSYSGAKIEPYIIDEKIRPGFETWTVKQRVTGQMIVEPILRKYFDPKYVRYENGDIVMHLCAKSKEEAQEIAVVKFAKLKELFNEE